MDTYGQASARNQAEGLAAFQAILAGAAVKTTSGARTTTDRSIGVTTSAQQAMAVNANRVGWKVKNDSDTDVYVRFTGTATAAAGGGNMKVASGGGYLASEPGMVESEAMSIIHGGTGTKNVTVLEYT